MVNFGGSQDVTASIDYGTAGYNFDNSNGFAVNDGDNSIFGAENGTSVPTGLRGLIIPNPSLRRQTVLAMSVRGDICPTTGIYAFGRIEVGQVVRVQASGITQTDGSLLHGFINAHIIAKARDHYLYYGDPAAPPIPAGFTNAPVAATGFNAIETISAGSAIRGKIIAVGRAKTDYTSGVRVDYAQEMPAEPSGALAHQQWDDKHWLYRGSISNVVTGPVEPAGETSFSGGIQEDIQAPLGRISSIRTTGAITKYEYDTGGTTLTLSAVAIFAGDGLLETRIINAQTTGANQAALAKYFNANLKANGSVQRLGHDLTHDLTNDLNAAKNQGVVWIAETGGRMLATIECDNMIDPATGTLAAPTPGDKRDRLGRCGVFAYEENESNGGNTATGLTVIVKHIAHNVSIVAPTIGTVAVGKQFKGSIVAYGIHPESLDNRFVNAYGTIASLDIGRGDFSSGDPFPSVNRGFVGGDCPPADLRPYPPASTGIVDPTPPTCMQEDGSGNCTLRMDYDADRYLYLPPPGDHRDGGSIDSVIRAEQLISKVQIYSMSQWPQAGRADRFPWFTPSKPVTRFKPRIEARHINLLQIDGISAPSNATRPTGWTECEGGMFAGVVWSGVVRYPDSGGAVVVADPAANPAAHIAQDFPGAGQGQAMTGADFDDAYASTNAVSISRIEANADVWVVRTDATDIMKVWGNMNGELHLPLLQSITAWRIGGKLGGPADWPFGSAIPQTESQEQSPRGLASLTPTTRETPVANSGAVYVAHDKSGSTTQFLEQFEGVVVTNAAHADGADSPQEDQWAGLLRVGDPWLPTLPLYSLLPVGLGGTGQNIAPEYHRKDVDFCGDTASRIHGGAFGVVPYALHEESCNPPNPAAPTQALNIEDWFAGLGTTGPHSVWLRFYGPLKGVGSGPSGQDVVVSRLENGATFPGTAPDWADVSDKFQTVLRSQQGAWYAREVAVEPVCGMAYLPGWYRVTRLDPSEEEPLRGLRCLLTLDEPPVAPFTYYFRLFYHCADIGIQGGTEGSDGLFDNNDFIVFINWFFNHDPRADIGKQGGLEGADDLWDNNDFVVFINWFFAQEPCGQNFIACPSGFAGRAGGGEDRASALAQGAMSRSGANPATAEAAAPERSIADVIASLQQAIDPMPPGPQRTQMELLLQALQNP